VLGRSAQAHTTDPPYTPSSHTGAITRQGDFHRLPRPSRAQCIIIQPRRHRHELVLLRLHIGQDLGEVGAEDEARERRLLDAVRREGTAKALQGSLRRPHAVGGRSGYRNARQDARPRASNRLRRACRAAGTSEVPGVIGPHRHRRSLVHGQAAPLVRLEHDGHHSIPARITMRGEHGALQQVPPCRRIGKSYLRPDSAGMNPRCARSTAASIA
jgi:hypothetical protein